MDTTVLRKRFLAVKTERSNIEGALRLIAKFIMPFSGSFHQGELKEELAINWRETRDLYDSTAVLANQNLAANIHSGLTNPVVQWFDMVFRDPVIRKNQQARKWMESCSGIVFVTLQESNFNLEVNETYLDLTSFGTSVLVEEVLEDKNRKYMGIDFRSTPLEEAYFEDDHRGQVLYFYRELQWTPLQILYKFKDQAPEEYKKMVDEGKDLGQKEKVIFAIFPRELETEVDTSSFVSPIKRPFGWVYFREKDGLRLGEEGGYYEMPAFVPRWRKTAGSKWGHSPGMICLSDVLTLNELVRLVLKAAEKVVDPPILTTRRGVFGDIDTDAGGVTVVQSMDAFKPYESGARFDVSALTKQDLQQSIRQTFFMDQLQLKESPAMTATEVSVRYEMMQRMMGPTLSRLQYDFLDPLVQRTFRILYRYGRLPKAPEIVKEAKAEFDVEYTGPMARAQKADQVTAIERWLGTLAQLSAEGGYPRLRDLPNVDVAGRMMGELGGVPLEAINDDDTIKKNRKDQAEKQKQVEQLEGMKAVAEVAGKAGPALQQMGGGGGQEAA